MELSVLLTGINKDISLKQPRSCEQDLYLSIEVRPTRGSEISKIPTPCTQCYIWHIYNTML